MLICNLRLHLENVVLFLFEGAMVRFFSFLFSFTFSCALLLAQSDPIIKNLKMDCLVMKTGEVFKGMFIEQNLRYLVFKTVEKKIDGPLRTFELTLERKEIETVIWISPKDRALLETQLKQLANALNLDPPLARIPLPDAFKNMELVPLIGNTEPPRLRHG